MSSLTSVQVTRFCQYIQFPSILQSDEMCWTFYTLRMVSIIDFFQAELRCHLIVCLCNAVKHIMQLVQRLPIFYILTAPLHPLANIKGRGGRF